MHIKNTIPEFGLYGEQGQFPDVLHFEDFSARAPDHDWRIVPHRHSQMSQLFMVTTGWIDATLDDTHHRAKQGDFIYIPERCVHEFIFRPNSHGGIFSFPLSVVTSISPNTTQIMSALSQPFVGTTCQRLEMLTNLLRDTTVNHSPFRAQQVVGMAHSVLAQLAETHLSQIQADQNPKPTRLFALNDLIARHLSDGWSASDFAKALNISTGHLSRLCRGATGLGAAAYIEQRRMEEACRLLAFTQLPTSEVGYRLGYFDPSYFSKRFRAARGQTPTEYRSLFTN